MQSAEKIKKDLGIKRAPRIKKAFSLIELSIVIIIISILISGILSSSITSINNAKIRNTRDRMAQIYQALGQYLVVNKRLPCPASIILLKSDADYGKEVGTDGSCSGTGIYQSSSNANLVYGMVPIRALGLVNEMGEDGFESKIAYIID